MLNILINSYYWKTCTVSWRKSIFLHYHNKKKLCGLNKIVFFYIVIIFLLIYIFWYFFNWFEYWHLFQVLSFQVAPKQTTSKFLMPTVSGSQIRGTTSVSAAQLGQLSSGTFIPVGGSSSSYVMLPAQYLQVTADLLQ